MGMDLSLLPYEADHADGFSFSHSILRTHGNYALFAEIKRIKAYDVSEQFSSYMCHQGDSEETHYGITTMDPYGDHLKYVTVGELLKAFHAYAEYNEPALMYLRALPDATKVALMWH